MTGEPELHLTIELDHPLDLVRTLQPLGASPALRFGRGEVWRATLTTEGPATVRMTAQASRVDVDAWGPGAGWAARSTRSLIGEDDDPSTFRPQHDLIARLHRSHPGLRLPRTQGVFEVLVPTVIGQLVTGAESHESYRSLVYALGEPAPGPERLVVPPGPAVLAATPYWRFHGFGIERRRAETLIRAARSARRLEETLNMSLPEAYRRLHAFVGVGPWTAAKVAGIALGDPDAVPLGDYHLPHTVGYAFEGTARSTDERMLELLEPYRGHRARVIRLLTLAGITAPRFGPRRPLRDFARS